MTDERTPVTVQSAPRPASPAPPDATSEHVPIAPTDTLDLAVPETETDASREPEPAAAPPHKTTPLTRSGPRRPSWTFGIDRETAFAVDRAAPLAEGEREAFLVDARFDGESPGSALLTDRRLVLVRTDAADPAVREIALACIADIRYRVELTPPVVEIEAADGSGPLSFRVPPPGFRRLGIREWFDRRHYVTEDPNAGPYRDPTGYAFQLLREALEPEPVPAPPAARRRDAASDSPALVEARGLIAVRRDCEAAALLRSEVATGTASAEAWTLLATALWNDGRSADALEAAGQGLRVHPGNGALLATYGFVGGIAPPTPDPTLAPTPGADAPADTRGAAAFALMRRDPERLATAAAEIERDDPKLGALLRGHAGLIGRRWEDAVRAYTRVLELDPYDAQAYVNRSAANHRLRRRGDAATDALRAVRLTGSLRAREALFRAVAGRLSNGQRGIAAFACVAFMVAFGDFHMTTPAIVAAVSVSLAAAAVLLVHQVVGLRGLHPDVRVLYRRPPRHMFVAGNIAAGIAVGYWLWRLAAYLLPLVGMGAAKPDVLNQTGAAILGGLMTLGAWAVWAWLRRDAHLRWADMSAKLRDTTA